MARPRQVSDEEILDAARACFLEQGPAVSTSVIADRLGVSQAALFKRFGTKQGLMLQAMMPPEVPGWIDAMPLEPDERPIPDQLREIAQEIAVFFDQMMPRLALIRASGCDLNELLGRYERPPPLRAQDAVTKWLRAARDQGRLGDETIPRTTAIMLLGSLQGRAFFNKVLGLPVAENRDQYVYELVSTLWRGIAPVEDP